MLFFDLRWISDICFAFWGLSKTGTVGFGECFTPSLCHHCKLSNVWHFRSVARQAAFGRDHGCPRMFQNASKCPRGFRHLANRTGNRKPTVLEPNRRNRTANWNWRNRNRKNILKMGQSPKSQKPKKNIQNQKRTCPHPAKKRGLGPLGPQASPPLFFAGRGGVIL